MTPTETHDLMAPLLSAYELNMLDAEDRKQMANHICHCDECFETFYRFIPVNSGLLQIKKSETVKAPEVVQHRRWHWLLTAIMAMLLVMAFWLFRQSSKLQEEIMKGAAQIQLISPPNHQEVQSPVVFRWEEEPEAEFYKIYVFKNEIIFVEGEHVSSPQFEWVPPSTAKPGKYQWKVESYFSDGTRIRDSVTFAIKLEN